jgi:hypothetical protein
MLTIRINLNSDGFAGFFSVAPRGAGKYEPETGDENPAAVSPR